MSEQKCRKVYVPVNLDVDAEGNIRPGRMIHVTDSFAHSVDIRMPTRFGIGLSEMRWDMATWRGQ